jgi:hypothetical protein
VPPVASVLRNLEYPSAQSIPAISIMRPEPRLPEPDPPTASLPTPIVPNAADGPNASTEAQRQTQ